MQQEHHLSSSVAPRPALGDPPSTTDSLPLVMVEISALVLDGSPRMQGEDTAHTRLLMETDETLPPILVHQETMRVIDGVHRVRAAQIKGATTIAAQLHDCDENAAFVLAVARNVAHGLPLLLADRKAAAARIIVSYPNWSNRAIAEISGLSDRTVRTIRQCSTAEMSQLNTAGTRGDGAERVGKDGRVRPLSSAEGRQRASQIIAERPTIALRTVAKAAGISLGTAHDVRARMRRKDDCNPVRPRKPPRSVMAAAKPDLQSILESLRKDPSLKFTDAGRCVLRWLCARAIEPKEWEPLLESVPAHSTRIIAKLARSSADAWQEFARELEQRGRLVV